MRSLEGFPGESPCGESVTGTATTAAATAAGEAAGRAGGASRTRCGEHGELDGRLFAGALGTGDFLLLVNDDLLKALVALFADVFVDRHDESLSKIALDLA
jgi:hypothetical protein